MGFRNRSVVSVILLSLFTCGIYPLYFFYTIQEEMRQECPEQNLASGATVILLSFVTCGIYTIYWMYVTAKNLDYIVTRDTGNPSDDAVLFTLIGVLLASIAYNALIQNKINVLLIQRGDAY